jgi:hypothetical protein
MGDRKRQAAGIAGALIRRSTKAVSGSGPTAATRNGWGGSYAANTGYEGGRSAWRFRANNDQGAAHQSGGLFDDLVGAGE